MNSKKMKHKITLLRELPFKQIGISMLVSDKTYSSFFNNNKLHGSLGEVDHLFTLIISAEAKFKSEERNQLINFIYNVINVLLFT